jgi:hypothetical protein
MNPNKLNFTFSEGIGIPHDASVSEISLPIQICNNYSWLLVPKSTGLDAAPTYSFEVSDDLINWQPYETATLNAAINQPFDDTHMPGIWFRINYNALTNTTGTVEFDITLKQ